MSDENPMTDENPKLEDNIVPEPTTAIEPSTEVLADSRPTQQPDDAPVTQEKVEASAPAAPPSGGGPISLDRIRQLRMSQQSNTGSARPPRPVREESAQAESPVPGNAASNPGAAGKHAGKQRPPRGDHRKQEVGVIRMPEPAGVAAKVQVPSRRHPLSQDLEDELASFLVDSDLDSILVGDSMLQVGHLLEEGQRLQGRVVKAQGEFVFLSLGGPNEGLVPAIQFEALPAEGSLMDVIVRGYLAQEGLYELTIPGNAVSVSDWSEISEGDVIEVLVSGSNTGGLECTVGNIRGFIPASQAAEYRIEDLSELVGQKVLCVVTEANERRGNLVLSRRAVLEREKKAKREERLANLEIGAAVDGTVTKIMDFGAFVDIGGLDGLLHISQLSWDRVSHPSELLQVGQKIQVRVDKIDEQSGKIGLSYRSLQEHPWSNISERFPVGTLVKGAVTRIAEFGAFVRIATGVEGLVHVSELAHHRVQRVSSVVSEGQEIEVKVLSVDEELQRMSLSLKAAQAAPEVEESAAEVAAAAAEPPAKPVLPKHQGPLKGGTGKNSGGDQFGLKW